MIKRQNIERIIQGKHVEPTWNMSSIFITLRSNPALCCTSFISSTAKPTCRQWDISSGVADSKDNDYIVTSDNKSTDE